MGITIHGRATRESAADQPTSTDSTSADSHMDAPAGGETGAGAGGEEGGGDHMASSPMRKLHVALEVGGDATDDDGDEDEDAMRLKANDDAAAEEGAPREGSGARGQGPGEAAPRAGSVPACLLSDQRKPASKADVAVGAEADAMAARLTMASKAEVEIRANEACANH